MQPARRTVNPLIRGRAQQRLCLIHRQRLRRPPIVTGGRADQRGHVPPHQVVGLGMSDGPHQGVEVDDGRLTDICETGTELPSSRCSAHRHTERLGRTATSTFYTRCALDGDWAGR